MSLSISKSIARSLAVTVTAALLAGCADDPAPVAPDQDAAPAPLEHRQSAEKRRETARAIATMRRVTARYHDLRVAERDGFLLLHECENRPGEGPVGIVYYHPGRLMDGKIDPASPDALIYEPGRPGRRPELVGVEFAVVDAGQEPPTFLGQELQREEEFGVFGLHAWVWRHNPEGMFAESNPRVSCLAK